MTEISPAVIKKTQETLGKYVKKPPLTEKLLKKPPFRFLHDLVNAIIKETGFLKGLYKPEELVSENVKDRDAKILFLQKLIDVTSIATKKSISAKPSKIVAGQEPEKTNELLQIIAVALQNKSDSKKAIEEWKTKQVGMNNGKAGLKKGEKVATKKPTPKISNGKTIIDSPPIATDDKITEDSEKKPRVDSGIVEDTGNPVQEEEILQEEKEQEVKIVPETPPVVTEKEPEIIPNNASLEPTEPPPSLTKPVDEKQELIDAIDEEADRRKKEVKEVKKVPPSRKSSSDNLLKEKEQQSLDPVVVAKSENKINSVAKKEQRKAKEQVETNPSPATATVVDKRPPPRPRTSLRPPSVRPASARPGAPRKKDRNVEVILQPDENIQLGDINVKVEQFKSALKDDEDDDNLIVIEDIDIQDTLLKQSNTDSTEEPLQVDDNQGQLVKQILETQKEFESGDVNKNEALVAGKNNNVAELRDQIQKLTKSIQPLGKFMDFLLEDIDSMQREHEMWRERGKDVALKLARERNSTENTVQSLKHQLEEIEADVEEKRISLFTVRENILQNEERILKLFKNL